MRANYVIVEDDVLQKAPLVIRDVGPWSKHRTVTNDVREVVKRLVYLGCLPIGRELFYHDNYGHLDQILIEDGEFAGFVNVERILESSKQ